MSTLSWRRALSSCGLAAALLLGGCTPIDLFGPRPEPTPTPVPEPTPEPEPIPEPTPEPEPTPVPTEVLLVVSGSLVAVPEGSTGALQMKLSAAPATDLSVTVGFTTSSSTLKILSSATRIFTPDNWDVAQELSFSCGEDADTTDESGTLNLALEGAAAVVVSVVGADNDAPTGEGVRLTVKDASGEGAVDYPITAVLPMEFGKFQSTDRFRMTDGSGNPIPAQFEVVNRYWGRDNSLRHVAAHFNASVAPLGQSFYFFKTDNGAKGVPAKPVKLTDATDAVTVDTGAIRFKLKKAGFNMFDEVHMDLNGDGSYASTERVVAPGTSEGAVFTGRLAGDIQKASARTDVKVKIEESGPMRAVIRVSSLGNFYSTTNHTHGFAMRIYAYAGKSFVRVEYQLQNSAKNVTYSWPLYFNDVSLHVKPEFTGSTVRVGLAPGQTWSGGPGSYLFQTSLTDDSVRRSSDNAVLKSASVTATSSNFAWVDVADGSRGMAVIVRHMAEMWPNGIEVEQNGNVAVRLWPKWGEQYPAGTGEGAGLYWLADMQHVVKEALFFFHGANAQEADLQDLASNFQYQPVAFVPVSEYKRTMATGDLDGVFPKDTLLPGTDARRLEYENDYKNPSSGLYVFGWMNFGGDPWRRFAAGGGGWPACALDAIGSARIDKYIRAERMMWGDLNTRPVWMAEYDHDTDYDLIMPTVNPTGTRTYRKFTDHNTPEEAAPWLPGTTWSGWHPRDNEHGWYYHIEEFYNFSYNLWVRDWYEWMGEFRKRTLFTKDWTTETSRWDKYVEWWWETRGEGHMLANATQAFRVTGDRQLLDGLRNRLDWLHNGRLNLQYGIIRPVGEAPFQNGYFARALLGIYHELKGTDPEYAAKAFNMAWGIIDWNYYIGRWAYYVGVTENTSGYRSDGSSLTMVDPVCQFYLRTGRRTPYLTDAFAFVDNGLNGGERPYGGFPAWTGGFEGRMQEFVRLNPKASETPPPAVTDLKATPSGGTVRLEWTAPSRAARYIIVRSTYPISRTYTKAADLRNFWAGDIVSQNLAGAPGSKQTVDVTGLTAGTKYHFALVAFDATENMSDVSNVAQATP